jgi:hypothetical protein
VKDSYVQTPWCVMKVNQGGYDIGWLWTPTVIKNGKLFFDGREVKGTILTPDKPGK